MNTSTYQVAGMTCVATALIGLPLAYAIYGTASRGVRAAARIVALLPVAVLIWHAGGSLAAFFPLVFDRVAGGLPRLQLWKHRYCFLNTPLIAREHGPGAVGAFMDWVSQAQ